ncbi:hypothetical protein LCGC14_3043970, partial [marine sediment metagenome]
MNLASRRFTGKMGTVASKEGANLKLSIVMPVFNEKTTIKEILRQVRS